MNQIAREKALDILLSGEVNYDLMVAHLILFRPDILLALQQMENPAIARLKKLLHFSELPGILTQEDVEYYLVMLKRGAKINCIKHYRDKLMDATNSGYVVPRDWFSLAETSRMFREAEYIVNPKKRMEDEDRVL